MKILNSHQSWKGILKSVENGIDVTRNKMTPLNKRDSQKRLAIEETALCGGILCNHHKKCV